ncbi:hypothetical protein BKA69DRAFT_1126442 [Paraphysoderma sedebokerense]|nr:hypothetical protein BKA69DRAFT_1126442 [Paraphysoderma sedebokerense]
MSRKSISQGKDALDDISNLPAFIDSSSSAQNNDGNAEKPVGDGSLKATGSNDNAKKLLLDCSLSANNSASSFKFNASANDSPSSSAHDNTDSGNISITVTLSITESSTISQEFIASADLSTEPTDSFSITNQSNSQSGRKSNFNKFSLSSSLVCPSRDILDLSVDDEFLSCTSEFNSGPSAGGESVIEEMMINNSISYPQDGFQSLSNSRSYQSTTQSTTAGSFSIPNSIPSSMPGSTASSRQSSASNISAASNESTVSQSSRHSRISKFILESSSTGRTIMKCTCCGEEVNKETVNIQYRNPNWHAGLRDTKLNDEDTSREVGMGQEKKAVGPCYIKTLPEEVLIKIIVRSPPQWTLVSKQFHSISISPYLKACYLNYMFRTRNRLPIPRNPRFLTIQLLKMLERLEFPFDAMYNRLLKELSVWGKVEEWRFIICQYQRQIQEAKEYDSVVSTSTETKIVPSSTSSSAPQSQSDLPAHPTLSFSLYLHCLDLAISNNRLPLVRHIFGYSHHYIVPSYPATYFYRKLVCDASVLGHVQLVEYFFDELLFERKERESHKQYYLETSWRNAIMSGKLEIVKYLVEKKHFDLHFEEDWAIRHCAAHNFTELTSYLLTRKANLHTRGNSIATKLFSHYNPEAQGTIEVIAKFIKQQKVNGALRQKILKKWIAQGKKGGLEGLKAVAESVKKGAEKKNLIMTETEKEAKRRSVAEKGKGPESLKGVSVINKVKTMEGVKPPIAKRNKNFVKLSKGSVAPALALAVNSVQL